MSSIDYFLSSIQGNANKRDYVKKYVITFIFVYDILGNTYRRPIYSYTILLS